MKKYTELKELLADYTIELINKIKNNTTKECENLVNEYCKANSLALGKQKPLAKNKQSENKCECSIINGKGVQLLRLCDYCIDKSWKEAFK